MERNKYDHKDCMEMGINAQDKFSLIAIRRGWSVRKATRSEDIYQHWDILIKKGNVCYKVDVKAMKRMKREDKDVQDEWVWVELHGVRKNDEGWLYGSKSDIIAFEKKDLFIMVKRSDLIGLIPKLVDLSTIVYDVNKAKYKVYQRSGRPDRVTLIESFQLEQIKWTEWNKS